MKFWTNLLILYYFALCFVNWLTLLAILKCSFPSLYQNLSYLLIKVGEPQLSAVRSFGIVMICRRPLTGTCLSKVESSLTGGSKTTFLNGRALTEPAYIMAQNRHLHHGASARAGPAKPVYSLRSRLSWQHSKQYFNKEFRLQPSADSTTECDGLADARTATSRGCSLSMQQPCRRGLDSGVLVTVIMCSCADDPRQHANCSSASSCSQGRGELEEQPSAEISTMQHKYQQATRWKPAAGRPSFSSVTPPSGSTSCS